jgi:hypothetical protein
VILVALVLAPAAHAQDRVYWTEVGGGSTGLSFATLDGSGGGTLTFPTPKTFAFYGLTVDTAAGRFYWSDENTIESMAFDGTGQRTFDTGGVLTTSTRDLSIDPDGRRLIWSRESRTSPIEIARLDGGGGGPLTAPAMTIPFTTSLVFDPPTQRVYFAGRNFPRIPPLYFAAIDGSGGGALPLEGLEPEAGLAIDHANGRIYWVTERGTIHSANLDGSAPALVPTGLATVAEPEGLAIDEATGTIYWGNRKAHALSFARLDGSGGGQLNIGGSLPGNTIQPVLLVAPRSAAAPVVTGTASPGATLTCTAEWAPDQPQANLFDAAGSVAYRWTRDGAPIAGADGRTLTVPAAGSAYACAATATNVAGSTTVASAPFAVPLPPAPRPPGFGAATAVTVALARGPIRRGALVVAIENFNPFAVGGELTASPTAKNSPPGAKIAARAFTVGASATATATLRLPGPLRKLLEARGMLKLKLAATVADPLGTRRDVAATAVAKLNHAKPLKPKPNKHRARRAP